MGTSASENIALQITSSYDGKGTAAATKDMGALATAGKGAQGALADLSKTTASVAASAQAQTASLGPAFHKWAAGALEAGASLESLELQWVKNQKASALLTEQQRKWLAEVPATVAGQNSLGEAAERARSKVAGLGDALATAGSKGARGGAAPGGAPTDATAVNKQLGAFEALGKKIDVTNASAVQGYRAQGDALAANLLKLGATDAELNKVGAAISKVERAAGASMLDPKSPQTVQISKLPASIRGASNAVTLLGQAAVTGTGSMAGLANAIGNVGQGLASMSNNAKVAAGATGIGAVLAVAGLALGGVDSWMQKTKELNAQLQSLQSTGKSLSATIGGDDLAARLEQLRQAAAEQRRRIEEMGIFETAVDKFFGVFTNDQRAKERAAQVAAINKNLEKSVDLAKLQFDNETKARALEKQRLIENGALALKLEQMRTQAANQFTAVKRKETDDVLRGYAEQFGAAKSSFDLQKEQITVQERQHEQEIQQQFERRDAAGAIIPLLAAEIAQRAILLQQNEALATAQRIQVEAERQRAVTSTTLENAGMSDDFTTRFQARVAQLEVEKQQQIQALGDIDLANTTFELKKRALSRETARQASTDAKTLFDAFRTSSNNALKAIGTFGENLRRIAIGAEAARAAVRAAVEVGEAIASAAHGDLAGAALHGAAALQLGAAAALGFRESLGGGGGGGAGGGGGGAPTFQPRDTGGGGNVVVNLYTVDPYNAENIRKVSYFLERQKTLKVPIYPTTGLIAGVA